MNEIVNVEPFNDIFGLKIIKVIEATTDLNEVTAFLNGTRLSHMSYYNPVFLEWHWTIVRITPVSKANCCDAILRGKL